MIARGKYCDCVQGYPDEHTVLHGEIASCVVGCRRGESTS